MRAGSGEYLSRPAVRHRAASLLLLAGMLSACRGGDLLAPAAPAGLATTHQASTAPAPGPAGATAFVCFTSVRTPGARYRYRYGRDHLHFPRTALSPSGARRMYRYRQYAASGELVVAANCLIPATDVARVWTNRHFRLPDSAGQTEHQLLGDAFLIDGLAVNACQNGEEWPDCEDEGGSGDNTTPVYTPPAYGGGDPSGGSGGGGGNGSTPEGDDPDPGEPCNTGNPVVDSPAVQSGFDQLWSASNADAPQQADRRERGGWIVRTLNGYAVQPFPEAWAIGPCGIDAPGNTAPPPGTVAWVHTHPFGYGELATTCDAYDLKIGGTTVKVYTRYTNDPSSDDGMASAQWGIPDYVIDKDKITEFTGNPSSPNQYDITSRVNRCGY